MDTVFQVAFIVMCWQGDCTRFESSPYPMTSDIKHCEQVLRQVFTNSVGPYYDDKIDFETTSPEDLRIQDAGCEHTMRVPEEGTEWKIKPKWQSPKHKDFLQDPNDLRWQQQQERNID